MGLVCGVEERPDHQAQHKLPVLADGHLSWPGRQDRAWCSGICYLGWSGWLGLFEAGKQATSKQQARSNPEDHRDSQEGR